MTITAEINRENRYREIGKEIGELIVTKQRAYGDAFGKAGQILKVLYPKGVPLEALDDYLTIVRIVDKLFRIATDRDALGESPWRDIMGYSLLAVERIERQRATLDPSPRPEWDKPQPMPPEEVSPSDSTPPTAMLRKL
jgi:hypothetical protein